jgi:hypothetical protein
VRSCKSIASNPPARFAHALSSISLDPFFVRALKTQMAARSSKKLPVNPQLRPSARGSSRSPSALDFEHTGQSSLSNCGTKKSQSTGDLCIGAIFCGDEDVKLIGSSRSRGLQGSLQVVIDAQLSNRAWFFALRLHPYDVGLFGWGQPVGLAKCSTSTFKR